MAMNQNEQKNRHDTAEDKRANHLCVGAVLLDVFAVMLQRLPRLFWSASDLFYTQLVSRLDAASTLAGIAGLAVIIYVRVRYPANLFGKVLMWLMVILYAMALLTLAVAIVSCGGALKMFSQMG